MNDLDKRLQQAYQQRKQENKPDVKLIKKMIRHKHQALGQQTSNLMQNFTWALAAFAFICFGVVFLQPVQPNKSVTNVAIIYEDIQEVHSLDAGQYRKQINESYAIAGQNYEQSARKPVLETYEGTALAKLTILENQDWILEDCTNHTRLLIKSSLLNKLDKPTIFDEGTYDQLLAMERNDRGEITRIFTPTNSTLLVCP